MARKRNPIALWCKTSLTLLFLWCTRRVPLPIARRVGRLLGRASYYVVPRVRTVGLKNLHLAYGDTKSDAEKRAILKASMENLGILAAEFGHLHLLRTEHRKQLLDIKGFEVLRGGPGGLMIGAHLSNWEWMVGAVNEMDYKKVGVVRPLRDPRLNAAIERQRGGTGIETIGKKDAGPEIIRAIREGNYVGVLVDQSTRKNGVPVTFFDQPCWATIAPVMIAMRTKTPIYPVTMARDANGFYTVELLEPIVVERKGNIHQNLIDGTQQCQDVIEDLVRKNPEQWMWIHDRWKAQPGLEREWAARLERGRPREQ